jgi:hypothetical protein
MNRVKIRGDIPFNYPEKFLVLLGAPRDALDGIHGASGWAKSKGVRTEIRFKDGFQYHSQGFLYNPVLHGRNP